MKKLFYLLLAVPMVFAACEDSDEGVDKPVEKTPVLKVTETTLDFTAEGGAGVINYSVENAVEGTEVEATCEADWVTGLTVAETITFTVAANESEAREATIVVTYGELSKSVAVKQAAKPNTPVFEAVTATVEYEWDVTMGEVEYKLENPIEGVEVKAKTGESWISQVQVKDGKILFAMTENTGDAREGKITAEYGMLPAIEFTVKQGAYVAPDPVVTINEESIDLAYDATESSFTYTVENPVEGVVAEATTDAEWISNLVVADGTVSFSTSVNEGFVREATITVTYGKASDSIVVKQRFAGQNPDLDYYIYNIHTFEAKPRTANTWDIVMSEIHPDLGQVFSRITVQHSEDNAGLIPTGEYSTEDGSILVNSATDNSNSSWRYTSAGADITICELYVENDLEAHTSYIEGMFQVGNEVYGFSYEGAVSGFMYEEIGEDGINQWKNWYIYSQWTSNKCSYVKANSAEGVKIELFVTNNVDPIAQGLGEGTYVVDDWQSTEDRFIEGGATGSSKINGIAIEIGGTMTVKHVGDNYRITIDFVDVNGNEYKGTYEGALPYTGNTDL